MSSTSIKSKKISQEEFDVVSNQISVFLAQRESLVKSWTASSPFSAPLVKTLEELDAEDAAMLQSQPLHLGIGAAIPSEFLLSETERKNNSLRAKLCGPRGLMTRKDNDVDEKTINLKKTSRDESSDEELGRSSLGRLKKTKISRTSGKYTHLKKFVANIDGESRNESRMSAEYPSQTDLDNRLAIIKSELADRETGPLKFRALEQNIKKYNNQSDENQTKIELEFNPDGSKNSEYHNINNEASNLMEREARKRMKRREKRKRQKLRNRIEALRIERTDLEKTNSQ